MYSFIQQPNAQYQCIWYCGLCVGLITRPEKSYRVWCVQCGDRKAPWGEAMNQNPVEAPQESKERKFGIVHLFALLKEYTNPKWTTLKSATLLFVFYINYASFLSKAYIGVVCVTSRLLMNIGAKWQRLFRDCDLLRHPLIQWRPQEFFSGGGGFNKFSWGQRTERMGIWGQ